MAVVRRPEHAVLTRPEQAARQMVNPPVLGRGVDCAGGCTSTAMWQRPVSNSRSMSYSLVSARSCGADRILSSPTRVLASLSTSISSLTRMMPISSFLQPRKTPLSRSEAPQSRLVRGILNTTAVFYLYVVSPCASIIVMTFCDCLQMSSARSGPSSAPLSASG